MDGNLMDRFISENAAEFDEIFCNKNSNFLEKEQIFRKNCYLIGQSIGFFIHQNVYLYLRQRGTNSNNKPTLASQSLISDPQLVGNIFLQ